MSNYAGVIWPLRLNTRGDFDKGSQREVVRSDIRTVLQTRRFFTLGQGGERVMRPGAYGLVPTLLFDIFDPDVLIPLVESWVEEALDSLVRNGKITIRKVAVTADYEPSRLLIKIEYYLREENIRDVYETEIQSFQPLSSSVARRI